MSSFNPNNNGFYNGRVTKKPQLLTAPSTGSIYCFLTVASDRKPDQNGNQRSDFISFKLWGKMAENAAKYLRKGSGVNVFYTLQSNSYKDKAGNEVYSTDTVATDIIYLYNYGEENVNGAQLQGEPAPQGGPAQTGYNQMPGGPAQTGYNQMPGGPAPQAAPAENNQQAFMQPAANGFNQAQAFNQDDFHTTEQGNW